MAWAQLFVAGILEVIWAYAMKQSDGFSRLSYTIITFVGMIASFWLLALAMRFLPLDTAYAVWTGIGAAGAFVLGIALLGESASLGRLIAAAMIVGGIVLMRVAP